MRTRRSCFAALLAVLLTPLALPAAGAQAQLRLPGLLSPPPPPPPAIAPVADPITRDPADGNVRGTVVMVHAGGWAGHDANAQRILFEHPGDIFTARGWRVVSLDYEEGAGRPRRRPQRGRRGAQPQQRRRPDVHLRRVRRRAPRARRRGAPDRDRLRHRPRHADGPRALRSRRRDQRQPPGARSSAIRCRGSSGRPPTRSRRGRP